MYGSLAKYLWLFDCLILNKHKNLKYNIFFNLVVLDKLLRLFTQVENEASDHSFSSGLNAVVL